MPTESEAAPAAANHPGSLSELFWTFTRMALQGFGGVLPVAQRELVERKGWMTREEFVEALSVSQLLPGANVVNLTMVIGDRHFGLRGALVALAGMLGMPMALVLGITALYAQFATHPMVSGALRGMGAVAAGLILSTAFKLAATLRKNPLGLAVSGALALLTFAGVALLHLRLLWVLLALGPIGVALAWRRLGRP
jgi:chromate transporter